jgi:hypothetical protein
MPMRSAFEFVKQRLTEWSAYFMFCGEEYLSRPYERHYGWLYGAVVACSMLILFARSPEMLLNPRFFAEDGRIFYQDAFNLGPLAPVFMPYAGYYLLLPRLIASISLALPISLVPLFFGLTTLIITSISLSWVFLPHFRPLIERDWIRLGVVGLCLMSPNLEALMVVAYLQWYVAAWCVFVVLMRSPSRRLLQWTLAIAYVIATATAPIVVLCTPIWMLRFYQVRLQEKLWIGLVLLMQLVIVLLTAYASRGTTLSSDVNLLVWDLWRAFAFKVVGLTLLGHMAADWLLQWFGWWMFYGLTSLTGFGIVLLLIRCRRERKLLMLSTALLFIVIGTSLLYAYRSAVYGYFFTRMHDSVPRAHARYFVLGSIALYLFVAVHLDSVMQRGRSRVVRSSLLGITFLMLLGYGVTFRIPEFGIGNWHRYGHWLSVLLDATQKTPSDVTVEQRDTGVVVEKQGEDSSQIFLPVVESLNMGADGRIPVAVPILPHTWCMTLLYTPTSGTNIRFQHGLSLQKISVSYQKDSTMMELLWTSSNRTRADELAIWFEIVTEDDQKVFEWSDTLILPDEQDCFPRLFASQHLLPLPANLSGGVYDLAIGLAKPEQLGAGTARSVRFHGLISVKR